MKKSVIVTTFEEAQRVIDVDYPESKSRAEDCVMEEDFPFSIFDNDGEWDLCYRGGGITFKEWEEEAANEIQK